MIENKILTKFYKTFSITEYYELTNEKLFELLFTYVKETKTVFNLGYSYGKFYTDTCKSNDYKELILDFILKDYEVCKNLIKTAEYQEDRENFEKECNHAYDTVREVLNG